MSRWGDEKTIRFIRLYREYDCLWNSRSSLYKSKIARNHAYLKIQEEMNEYSVKEIKNKIKGLRSTYHQELNKIIYSTKLKSGTSKVYKPSLSWFKEMDFLNITLENKNINFTDIQESGFELVTDPLEETDTSSLINNDDIQEQPQPSQSSPIPEQLVTLFKTQAPSRKRPQLVVRKPYQTRKRQPEPANETVTALQRLENIITTVNPRSNEDEFYYFGQSVAAQLRSLPLNNALDIQTKIQMLLSTERSQLYQSTASYSQSSTPCFQTSDSEDFSNIIPKTEQ